MICGWVIMQVSIIMNLFFVVVTESALGRDVKGKEEV